MSKICTACGAMNMDNATVCSRCKKPLQFQGNPSVVNATAGPIIAKGQGRKLPRIGIMVSVVAAIFIIIVAMVLMVKGSAPSEEWLAENVPMELLVYEFDSFEYTSSVESVEIERRDTRNGVDDAYCVIILADDMMKRTVYVEMISRKYNQGGWVLESWMEYQPEEGVALQGLEEDAIYSYLNEEEQYTGLSGYTDNSDVAAGILSYSCDVDEQHEYVSTSGSVVLNGELIADVDTLPHSYRWYLDIDSSGVIVDWNLDGDFGCEPNGLTGKYFYVSVGTDSEMIDWNVEYGIWEFRLGGGDKIYKYTGNGTDVIPEWHGSAALAELKIPLTDGYYLLYEQDTVWMLNSTTAFPSENELVRR